MKAWVEDIGLRELASSFPQHLVTGNMLLDLTVEDLMEIGFDSRVKSKWFLGQIKRLRCLADVSVRDRGNICKWLMDIGRELAVYKVDFVRSGVTKALLPHLTDELLVEIGVHSSVHRLKILLGVGDIPESSGRDTPDLFSRSFILPSSSQRRKYDVFISYRRATGAQLASLLKVHLHVRGLSVFLDVDELGSGKFDEAILTTISRSSNVIMVLSSNALDRCKGDTRLQDWVHKELVCALENEVRIVPVVDEQFEWPKEDDLPEDIQTICKMNAVSWSHEYQDASVDKVINFLHLHSATRKKSMSLSHPV